MERSRLIAHLVDASSLAPDQEGEAEAAAADAERLVGVIEGELAAFSPELAVRERVLVATKREIASAGQVAAVRKAAARRGVHFFAVSGAAHLGLESFVRHLGRRLEEIGVAPPAPPGEREDHEAGPPDRPGKGRGGEDE